MTKRADIYQKPSCTSCRKAVAELEARGIELIKHDLAKDPPSRALLERLVDARHLDGFVNTRSKAYKSLGLDITAMTKQQAIDLVLQETNLMKRPLVLTGDRAIFGYEPAEYETLA